MTAGLNPQHSLELSVGKNASNTLTGINEAGTKFSSQFLDVFTLGQVKKKTNKHASLETASWVSQKVLTSLNGCGS